MKGVFHELGPRCLTIDNFLSGFPEAPKESIRQKSTPTSPHCFTKWYWPREI
jgi:hypothetical protein